jgi:hypothetical protein
MSRFNSFFATALLIAPALTYAQTPSHRSGDSTISVDQVSFYEVPLACPAARGLGCGSAAKPALLSFEKKRSIQEAWLDHAGTTLAIAWKNGTRADARLADIQSVADDRGLSLHEITGERREETSKSFLSRTGWYRGTDVDRLSEEEAGVIVARLIHRAMLKEPTISAKAELLQTAFTKVVREQLIVCTSTQCREDCHKKLANIAREHLNDREFQALMEAEKQGYRPVGDEQ